MRRFLYWIPGGKPNDTSPERVRALGIGHAHDDGDRVRSASVSRGPDGGPGVVVGFNIPAADEDAVRYVPDRQAWVKVLGSDCMVGRYTDGEAMRPVDLLKTNTLDGHMVTLADGKQWLVPVARRVATEDGGVSGCVLPVSAGLDPESGTWRPDRIARKYQELWGVAMEWLDVIDAQQEAVDEAGGAAFLFHQIMHGACVALGCNYRLGDTEADLLGLMDMEAAKAVMGALVDLPTFDRWAKKKIMENSPAAAVG